MYIYSHPLREQKNYLELRLGVIRKRTCLLRVCAQDLIALSSPRKVIISEFEERITTLFDDLFAFDIKRVDDLRGLYR